MRDVPRKVMAVAAAAWLFCSCRMPPLADEAEWAEETPELVAESQDDLPDSATAIEIRCNVKKAYVFLNGEYQGQAPLVLRGLVPGTYRLFAERGPYSSGLRTLTVERGKESRFYVVLQPE